MALKNFTQFTPYTVLCATDYFVGYRQLDEIRTDWDSMIWEMSGGLIRKGFRVDLGDIPILSGNWNSNYTTVRVNSANWGSAYTTVLNNSAGWGPGSTAYVRIAGDTMTGALSTTALSARDFILLDRLLLDSAQTTNLFVANSSVVLANVTGQHNLVFGVSAANVLTSGNNNVILGNSAGKNLSTGSGNVMVGICAGNNQSTGSSNILIGNCAGACQSTGFGTIAIGDSAFRQGLNCQTIAIGHQAMGDATGFGSYRSVALGICAGLSANDACNVFIGFQAGARNRASKNVFIGSRAGATGGCNTGAPMYNNVFIGADAGRHNTGYNNTFIGFVAGENRLNTAPANASNNVAIGVNALRNIQNACNNVAIGRQTGYCVSSGHGNSFIGTDSGKYNTTGACNAFIGFCAGYRNITGNNNVFIGRSSGVQNETGCNNVFIGDAMGGQKNGCGNVLIGSLVASVSTTGICASVAMGECALRFSGNVTPNLSIRNHIALGAESSNWWHFGCENITVGFRAGANERYGSQNILLGASAGFVYQPNTCGNHNNIMIGNHLLIGPTAPISGTIAIGNFMDNIDKNNVIYLGSGTFPLSTVSSSVLTTTQLGLVVVVNGSTYRIPLVR